MTAPERTSQQQANIQGLLDAVRRFALNKIDRQKESKAAAKAETTKKKTSR